MFEYPDAGNMLSTLKSKVAKGKMIYLQTVPGSDRLQLVVEMRIWRDGKGVKGTLAEVIREEPLLLPAHWRGTATETSVVYANGVFRINFFGLTRVAV